MPIVIRDFNWKQTKDKIIIQVPLHGVHPSKADIFTSSQYIKVSLGSFFFETLLLHPVDASQISCTKAPTEILFDLKKCSNHIWDSLEVTNLSKQERIEFKGKLIQEEHERVQKENEAKKTKKSELKRVAINEQIELDTRVRNRIENIKKNEESKALGDLNKWKSAIEAPKIGRCKILDLDQDTLSDFDLNRTAGSDKIVKREENSKQEDFQPHLIKKHKIRRNANPIESKEKITSIPKPRSTRSLQVLFTPREFPTPSRESRLEEENYFLRKQAEARRSAGFVNEDLRPEEKNPQFLIAKGREFLKNNNYLGAISAFSFGIKLSPKFLDLYMVRSEAHLVVGNFKRAVDDCTSSLELLKPALPINLDDRALCIGRRGIALYKLGFMRQGISELEASLRLKKSIAFEKLLEEFQLEYEKIKEQHKENETIETECLEPKDKQFSKVERVEAIEQGVI